MKIVNEELLNRFRGPGVCEWCKRRVSAREPHHVFTKGFGGARRLDVPINLIALCATFSGGLNCHDQFHTGQILREDLLAIVAKRERTTQQAIQEEIWRLRRL